MPLTEPVLPAYAHPFAPVRAYWRPTFWLCGLLLGTAWQLQQAALWPAFIYIGCLALGVLLSVLLLLLLRPAVQSAVADRLLCLAAAAVLALGQVGWRAELQMQTVLEPALEGVDLVLEGTVVAMPLPIAIGQRFRLAVTGAQMQGQAVAVPPLVDLAWYRSRTAVGDDAEPAELPRLSAGQRWRLPVRLKAPHGSANPHGFDYELWMWDQGVQATGYVRMPRQAEAPQPQLLASTAEYPVEQLRQRVRDAMVQRLLPEATPPQSEQARIAGVLVALVTGEQRAIDRDDWRVFRITGVAHLMAISGLHITLFAWVATAVLGWGWRRSARLCLWLPAPRVALVGGVLAALAYSVFSGWGIPAQRTVLMLAVVVALRLSGRQWPWTVTWLLACACVVLVQPAALLQAGFWLSFLAVGILFASDVSQLARADAGLRQATWGAMRRLLREQGIVTVAITPLSLLLFGQLSVVGLLANLLAIPWVTWVVTPLALLGVAVPVLWDAAALAMQPLMAALQWFASWPHAALWLPVAPWWAAAAAVLGGVWMALPQPWRLRCLGLPLLLPALWWQPLRPAPGQFSLLALDVGQGQAVLVQTARHSLLYDAGPAYGPSSNAGDRVVVPTLRAVGAEATASGRLDMLVLSHADTDHTGGAAAVLEQLKPVQAMGSLLASERDHLGLAQLRPWQDCVAGMAWDWDGVRFSVLHPFSVLPEVEPPAGEAGAARRGRDGLRSGNGSSCVLRVQAAPATPSQAGSVALLVGDLEAPQERALLLAQAEQAEAASQALRADFLLVPHHGSNTSSSVAFLAAVQARWALVQSGYRNRFNHPTPKIVQRYADAQIPLTSTVQCGAAWWRSDEPQALQCQRWQRRHYWQHQLAPEQGVHQGGAVHATPVSEIVNFNPALQDDEG
ncbi:DNA internalization-related competence protein ComEC/Rec2 [Comamonas sp. J-3]|uniref:DNA internalization-related competence protein ComEC/Rec2 n=1 Tax=Comamonas trifloxystrobinivorans TaxID=3350256 RepID=UPI0037295500